jgi:long-chain acyl-CoA synthetase
MKGYWRRPDETAKVMRGDWFLTGDIGVMDEDGYFRIVDRKKDMVVVSGFNVYPNEIEDCLADPSRRPGIRRDRRADAATGEAVKAFVVARDKG